MSSLGTQVWQRAPGQNTVLPFPLWGPGHASLSLGEPEVAESPSPTQKPGSRISLWASKATLCKRVRTQLDRAALTPKDQAVGLEKSPNGNFSQIYT